VEGRQVVIAVVVFLLGSNGPVTGKLYSLFHANIRENNMFLYTLRVGRGLKKCNCLNTLETAGYRFNKQKVTERSK